MAGISQILLLLLFYCPSVLGLNVQLTSSEDEVPMSVNYKMYPLEVKRPFGEIYKGSYHVTGRLDEPDFANTHAASKRPFGGIYGKSYQFGKREFPPLEGHYEMKRPFGRIFGNYLKGKSVSGDQVEFKRPFGSVYGNTFKMSKRPFGSVYGQSYNIGKRPFGSIYGKPYGMGKRPFGSVYGQSFSMGKRPFGGVYGKSYKVGKRYTSPLVHSEVKRPFGKVYENSYKVEKRPFGQIYGKNYGKRLFSRYNEVPDLRMPFADSASLHPGLEDRREQLPVRYHDYKEEIFTEKRPFGHIYSKSWPFGKRSFRGNKGYPNDILMLSKRPFGRVYGRSYKLGKRPLKKHGFGKRSAYRPVVAVVDEYERPLLLTVATDKYGDYPLLVENNVSEDRDQKIPELRTTNGISGESKIDILDSSTLFPAFENIEDEEKQRRLYKNKEEYAEEDVSDEGRDFEIDEHDGGESSDYDENLGAIVPLRYREIRKQLS